MNDSNGTTERYYDYAEVAALARIADAAGQRMSVALAAHYGMKPTVANSLLSRVRRAGHDIPAGKRGPRVGEHYIAPCGTPGAYYRHRKAGENCQVCREANTAYRTARKRAERIGNPLPGVSVVDGRVRCSCGVECPNRTALGRHTWARHDRWPTDAERVVLEAVERAA